jgi:hypothetical protein
MTNCMTMAASKLQLSILRTEYETPAGGEWVTSRQANVEDGREADHTTLEGARSGCSEDLLAQCAAVAGPDVPPELTRHNLRRGVSIL